MSHPKLNQEETDALVRAMTSRVEIVRMAIVNDVGGLDLDEFRKYKGDGKCKEVYISVNYEEYDLTNLLDSISCKELHLYTSYIKRLNQEETKALVRAMTSRVEILQLGQKDGEDVCAPKSASIDFDTLTQYKGDGKCREVHCLASRMPHTD